MRPINGTLFVRNDLSDQFAKINFEEVNSQMIGLIRNKIIFPDDILIFMDDDGRTKIIKNQFGNQEIS